MKWLLITITVGIANVGIMQLFAKSKFGPTPLSLPFFLIVISVAFAITSILKALKINKIQKQEKLGAVYSAIIWILLAIYNFFHFNTILYVT